MITDIPGALQRTLTSFIPVLIVARTMGRKAISQMTFSEEDKQS